MGTDWKTLDDQVAALLETGATYRTITRQLNVGHHRIRRVRAERNILLPPDRDKRSAQELSDMDARAVAMLQAGATYWQVREATRLGLNRISGLRKHHGIPVPDRDRNARQRRTIEETFALYTRPTPDGHLLWAGPRSGRGVDLLAEGRKYNARAIAFEKDHGRPPQGRIWRMRACREPDCIAGAHHTDQLIRHGVEAAANGRRAGGPDARRTALT